MSEPQQRFHFRLRHLLLIVTLLCALFAVSVVAFPEFPFVLALVFVVGSAMARISTKSHFLWIVGPLYASLVGLICFFLIGNLVVLTREDPSPLLARFLLLSSLMFGGWLGGWLERQDSEI